VSILNAELVKTVEERSVDKLLDLNLDLFKAVDGVGNDAIDRSTRILRFLDLAQRGVLDILDGMGAPAYGRLLRQYERDMKAEMEATNG
jgi:hypothetical protein